MSKLIGPSNPGSKLDPELQARMDAPLMALAQQSGGDLRNMLGAFFSFLNRRTDFYYVPHPDDVAEVPDKLKMGFKEGDSEKLLLASFRQFPLRRLPKGVAVNVKQSDESSSPSSKNPTSTANPTSKESVNKVEKTDETTLEKTDESKSETSNDEEKQPKLEVRLSEEGKQVPVGNGGCSIRKGYHWTQTIEEVSIVIPLKKSTRGKDLQVDISNLSIGVHYKENTKGILEGKLPAKIRTSESTWSIEGGVLVLVLEKIQKSWWSCALQDDEEIDAGLIG